VFILTGTELRDLALDLIVTLQSLPASRLLPSNSGRGVLVADLSNLIPLIVSDQFDAERIIPLFRDVINKESDETVFAKAYAAVIESTPPPRPQSHFFQTPYTRSTSSIVNSSEHRQYMDDVLREELGSIYIGIPEFHEAVFGKIQGLKETAEAVFQRCKEGKIPLYHQDVGWRGWPKGAQEKDVLKWIAERVENFLDFTKDWVSFPKPPRGLLARPNQPLEGSTAERKLDIGIINDLKAADNSRYHWSRILVPGELKSNPSHDTVSKTWLDLGRYVREIFTTQDNRRFVLGFTLCGSIMRVWEFDRVGAVASPPFDVNKDGLQFVSVVLGYLCMNEEQLGFDPSIKESDGRRYIEIERDSQKERLILDTLMRRAPSVVGRATTCWKAYRDGDKSKVPLVIKDSWQYPERDQEGELLREATEKKVENVARYYHHETVQVGDGDDDVQTNIRRGLDVSNAANYQNRKTDAAVLPPITPVSLDSNDRGRSFIVSSSIGCKRSSGSINASIPPGKRTCSNSPTKYPKPPTLLNRVHRRVIISDYGKPLYRASSRTAMLAALEGCIKGKGYSVNVFRCLTSVGYKALQQAGILQRDISTGNTMMNEDPTNLSWPAFLIDLDLGIREQRDEPSGARGITGTRAFMAIGALRGEKHSAMHDYESFFWLLFWICIHYQGPDGRALETEFDCWNYEETVKLAKLKLGTVSDEDIFLETMNQHFTLYFKPFIPWMNRLRRIVFPSGRLRKEEDEGLASKMMETLREAQKDPNVL